MFGRRSKLSRTLPFLTLVLACSGAEEEPLPNKPPPVVVERTLCEVQAAGCKRQVACGAVVYNHARTEAACVAETDCAAFTKDVLTDLGVELDHDAVDACVAAIEALSCEEVAALRLGFGDDLELCSKVTVGSVPAGGECHGLGFDDCAPGLTCTYEDACPGTCLATREACVQGGCGEDAYCSYATGSCEPLELLGAACEGNLPSDYGRRTCAGENVCAWTEDGEWTCTAPRLAGASCDECTDPECCERGFFCNVTDGEDAYLCLARRQAGEDCYFAPQCSEGLYCDFDTGTCRASGLENESCSNSIGSCALGLVCRFEGDTGTCGPAELPLPDRAVLLAIDDACERGDVCPLGATCVDGNGLPISGDPGATGTCRAALGQPGVACEPSFDAYACAEGLCNFATGLCPSAIAVGDACDEEGLDTGCPFALCLGGKCVGPTELVCDSVVR